MSRSRVRIFLLLCHFCCTSQIIRFQQYSTKNGLLSDHAYNIYQDKKGYIWLFTNYGAMKYNGNEFRPVLKNLHFTETFIYSFYERADGRKWFANSKANVYEIVNDSAKLVVGLEDISARLRKQISEIFLLHVDSEENIYMVTKRDCYLCYKKGNSYSPVELNRNVGEIADYSLFFKDNQAFAVFNCKDLGYEALGFFEKDSLSLQINLDSVSRVMNIVAQTNSGIRRVEKVGDKIYLSLRDRLIVINKRFEVKDIFINSLILSFKKDKNEHLWIATQKKGLIELDQNDSIINDYFPNTTINDVLCDNQGGIWVTSDGFGVFHASDIDHKFFPSNSPLGIPIKFVKNFDSLLVVGTLANEILFIKNNTTELVRLSVRFSTPLNITKWKNEFYACGTYGLERLSGVSPYKSLFSDPEVVNAQRLLHNAGDTLIYIHRRGIGLWKNNKLLRRIDVQYKTYDGEFRGKELFIANENGVFLNRQTYDNIPQVIEHPYPVFLDTLTQPEYLRPTRNTIVTKICKDSTDRLWFCTQGNGIFILDTTNKLDHISVQDGLPAAIVNHLCFAGPFVLLSGNKGLYFTRTEKIHEGSWVRLYSGEVQNSVFFKDKIYAASTEGLIILDIKNAVYQSKANFNFVSAVVNSSLTVDLSAKALKYNQNNIEFTFDLINFSDNTGKFHYSLTGEIENKGSTFANTIKFTNLSPGEYTLTVYPELPGGKEKMITIPFSITPAFWQTLAFTVTLTTVSLLILFLLTFKILKNYKLRQSLKVLAEKQLIEYKLIALKAQVNPHFVSNCLTAIQHLIINNRLEAATSYVAKFGFLVRQILNFSDTEFVKVAEELEISRLNIELEQLRFENKFSYQLEVAEDIDINSVYVPSLILNPIIENAIWHGLLPLKGLRPAILTIRLSVLEEILCITIEDNGVGRNKIETDFGNIKDSRGILLTEQRLTNLNQLYNITESKITYEDLKADGVGVGTKVNIYLPLNLYEFAVETY